MKNNSERQNDIYLKKEELITFLKENLQVRVCDNRGLYDEHTRLTIGLYLGDECISEDFEYIY